VKATFASVLIQIMALDIVFSLDSVITAVGMVDHIVIMIAAVVVAIGFMLLFSGHIARFVEKHPTIKMLALSFLILIGVTLIAEGLGQHISKGYIYFAMAFSVMVELLNMKLRKRAARPVELHQRYVETSAR
jgi:predicted tellurium resistance membrane protein TerC